MLRRLAALSLLLAASLLLFAPHPEPAGARTAAPPGLDAVRAAYDDLLDRFFRVVPPAPLLAAGWDALRGQSPDAPPLGALPDDRAAAFDAFSAQFVAYAAGLPPDKSAADAAFAVIDGMAKSLHDQHTAFLTPSLFRSVLAELGGGKPVGPSFRLAARYPLIVSGVAPGGPAEAAGMLAGDQIDTVDGTPILRLSQDALIRGLETAPAGTTVVYGVTRDNRDAGAQHLDIPVTFGPYFFPFLQSRLLAGGAGYLQLSSFADGRVQQPDGTILLDDLDARLDALDAQGATGLVLDLRGNPGGNVVTAQELLGRFLPEDASTVIQSDQRGHEVTGIVAGAMRGRQLPMAVLVDRGSASASELVAATLRESNRAVLVGDRTLGALTSSNILPLPDDAGLQVAVADVRTARGHVHIDGAGVAVDVQARDTRRAADFRDGFDPQLDVAVQALGQAPTPPTVSSAAGLSVAELDRVLAGYMPNAAQVPMNDRLLHAVEVGSADLNQANELIGLGARDPWALLQRIHDRGWLGERIRSFAGNRRTPPFEATAVDLFQTAEGAAASVTANEQPDTQQAIPNLVELGDQTVTYRGTWFDTGAESIVWRRGRVVLSVSYADLPGNDRPETLVALARLLDAAYLLRPLPEANTVPPVAVSTPDLPPAPLLSPETPGGTVTPPSVPPASPLRTGHSGEAGSGAILVASILTGVLALATLVAMAASNLQRRT